MKERYVRVKPKSGAERFHRCGMLFTLAWALVTVDEATAARLDEEQMLEVSLVCPVDGFEAGTHGGGDIYADEDAGETPALQAQAEAEAAAQMADESAAEAEPVAPASRRPVGKKK